MDYEKVYKEALERVRRLHDRMLFLSSTDALVANSELEFIFPELAENEDERIRKWLIEYHKQQFENNRDQEVGLFHKDAIAWLEKQKEQKKKNVLIWGEPQVTITVQKQEWSEEDEEKLERVDDLLWMLDDYISDDCSICEERTARLRDEIHKELFPWLESLRPSWKPSEEQIRQEIEKKKGKSYYPAMIELLNMIEPPRWISVNEKLPPEDEEVIVLTDEMHGKKLHSACHISYGHRPNPEGWDGRSIFTGKVTHHDVVTYDGWNIPGVKYWMPCPELPEK